MQREVVVLQRWHAVLLMLESQALASLGNLPEACQTCEEAMEVVFAAGDAMLANAQTAQVSPDES